MDKAASVVAAFEAGKQPSQTQINAWIDYLLQSQLIKVEKTESGGELSENGRRLAEDARNVLDAYKAYASSKNKNNLVQEVIWHLRQADIASASLDVDLPVDKQKANSDYRALVSSLSNSLSILWSTTTSEGSGVFSDFTSFMRLALADAAESLGDTAKNAAESLREVEGEVNDGERDAVGRKRKSPEEKEEDEDVRVKFEKGMDTAKAVGSKTIGAGQAASGKAEELTDKSSSRLKEMYVRIAKRAQNDPQYQKSLDTIFDLIEKWINITGDAAADAADAASQDTSLESFVNDPTPEKHLIKGLRTIRVLVENFAGGKSLDDLFSALSTCVIDIRNDPNLKKWVSDFLKYSKKNLQSVGKASADEETETMRAKKDLQKRWKEISDTESGASGQKWSRDVEVLKKEVKEFEGRLGEDKELGRVRKAHDKFAMDLEEMMINAAGTGVQLALDQASWMWQDLFNVYLPRAMNMVQSIPIPRTEYKDPEVEFVLEDVDISSLSILPGHVYIRNITDIDISAPSASAPTTTAVGSLTHLQIQALQLQLKEVSFYYLDKTATVGPAEYKGIVEVTLPPQGIDVDVKLRLIPSTPEGLKAREKKGGHYNVERVEVKISEDVTFAMKESNHGILLSVFKPVLNTKLREGLATMLREQIQASIEAVDAILWDVGSRAEVFRDAGLSSGPALTAAFWSELGRMQRQGGNGLFGGWRATGTGVVKDVGANAKFAMGAEPQVLRPDQKGPKGTLSKPIVERVKETADEAGVDTGAMDVDSGTVESGKEQAKGAVQSAKEGVREGVKAVRTFEGLVERKREEEEQRTGWQSRAFDI